MIFKVSPWERVFVCERLIMLQKETPPPFSPTLLPTWHPGVFLVLPLGEGWRHTSLGGLEKPATNGQLVAGWPCRVEPTSVQILSFLNQHVATLWMGSLTGLFLLGEFTVRGILNQTWRYPGSVRSGQLEQRGGRPECGCLFGELPCIWIRQSSAACLTCVFPRSRSFFFLCSLCRDRVREREGERFLCLPQLKGPCVWEWKSSRLPFWKITFSS